MASHPLWPLLALYQLGFELSTSLHLQNTGDTHINLYLTKTSTGHWKRRSHKQFSKVRHNHKDRTKKKGNHTGKKRLTTFFPTLSEGLGCDWPHSGAVPAAPVSGCQTLPHPACERSAASVAPSARPAALWMACPSLRGKWLIIIEAYSKRRVHLFQWEN